MIEFLIGSVVGIFIPIFLLLLISEWSGEPIKKKLFVKKRSKNCLNEKQENMILKSFHQCKDVHWLNVFISRFWLELSKTNAQAYRFKSYIKKSLESIPTSKFIKEIDILDIDIGTDCPIVEQIEIVDSDQIEKLIHKSLLNLGPVDVFSKQFDLEKEKENKFLKDSVIYEKFFKNINAVVSILFQGSIRIKLKVVFPKEITLHTNVYIKKLKGDLFIRFPSLNYNTRLEYTFLNNPQVEIGVEAGVCKGESEGYFKKSISNFLTRLIKYTISKTFVYPSFNTLYVPLLIPTFKNYEHLIEKINFDQIEKLNDEDILKHFLSITEYLSMFIAMDYKIYKTFNGIIYRKNNFLLNNKDKIICAHFTLPEKFDISIFLNSSNNYNFKNLSCNENIIMNSILSFNIFKHIIKSFNHLEILKNVNEECSLVLIHFKEIQFEFLRIILDDTIFFQKNDPENPEFLIFRIKDSELFVYNFTYNSIFQITKNRLIKLKNLFDLKNDKKFSVQNILKASKNVLKFWKSSHDKIKVSNDNENLVDKYNVCENTDMLKPLCSFDLKTINNKLSKSYIFNCTKNVIFKILSQDEIRLKFIFGNLYKLKVINKKDNFSNIQIVDQQNPNECKFIQNYLYDDIVIDVIENKKVIYKIYEQDFEIKKEKTACNSIENKMSKKIYSFKSESENNLFYMRKKNQIYFKSENLSLDDDLNFKKFEIKKYDVEDKKTKTVVEIYCDENLPVKKKSLFYESIFIRIKKYEYLKIVENIEFENLDLNKELKKDFFGNIGSVYIEFKTDIVEEFKLILFSTFQKKNILEIAKVVTSKSFKLLIPIYEEDILLLRLIPKSKKNSKIHIKIANLPSKFQHEAFIDCRIGLGKYSAFTYPILGSINRIIYWEKDIDDQILGFLKNSCTKVPLIGSGTMRTDNMDYSIIYKNKGYKRKDIKLYMGYTTTN